MNRILGSNQTGSRIQTYTPTGHTRGTEAPGAFGGQPVQSNDYWSHVQQQQPHLEQQQEQQQDQDSLTPPPKYQHQDEQDEMVQSAKKKKVSFNNLTPPGGRSSKEMATPVGIAPRSSEKRMPTIATPYKIVKQKTYVSHRGDGDYERDEEGRVIYGSEEMHGKLMDLGVGCEGVEENDITRAVMDILEKNGSKKIYKFGRQKVDDGKNDADGASSSAVPYNFMPKVDSSSKKGASSLLNKSIAADAVKEDAITSPPPASGGWGNTFARTPGDWNCNTCRSKNPKETSKCLSCDIIKESEGGNDEAATSTPAVASTTFSFGGSKVDGEKNDQPATGGFTFAAPAVGAKKEATPVTGGFTFAAPTVDAKKDSTPVTGGFTFAAPTVDAKKDDKPVTGGFSFAVQPSTTEKKDDQTHKPSFTFGSTPAPAPASAVESKTDSTPKSTFTFGSTPASKPNGETVDAPTPAFTLGSIPAAEKTDSLSEPPMAFGSSFWRRWKQ